MYKDYHRKLTTRLIRLGAAPAEAEEIMADLWGDLFVPRSTGAPPLLASYAGRSSLSYWLSQAATHRFVDLKRKENRRKESPLDENTPAQEESLPFDQPFENLIRMALREAFAQCDAEALVMLRLVYLHGVSQRDIGKAWQWRDCKVSRFLKKATDNLREAVLDHVKKVDAGFELKWDEVLEICEKSNLAEIVG